MRQLIIFTLVLSIFAQCGQAERSPIEKVTVGTDLLQKIKTNYDTFYIDTPKGYDFFKVEVYGGDSTNQNFIFKDSLNNIQAIRMTENNVDIFLQEYYSNGQAKGKTEFLLGKIEGQGIYYYQDGRIKTKGQWKNGKRTGLWKNYNEDGFLTSIELLDENGDLIKKEKVK